MVQIADIKLFIESGGKVFEPSVESGIQVTWERTNSCGKMTFKVLKSTQNNFSFNEGDVCKLYYDEKPVFFGYVFTKKRDREGRIDVTCYDNLRYLKNKYTYVFEKKTASQIIKMLCADFQLPMGEIEDTKYVIPSLIKEKTTALDTCLTALQETLVNTGKMYVLYDDCGKITLKNCESMKSNTLIYNEVAENFNYTSSIDSNTYNSIVLYYKEKDNTLKPYKASSQATIKQWGVLRYFEEVKNQTIAQNKADSLLKLYNRKTRELTINGIIGDPKIRGGSMIPVKLNLGDIVTNNYMLVQKVTHKFEKDYYTMDVTVEGAW